MPGAPIDALKRVPLFADLDERELEAISQAFQDQRFSAGETVIEEGSAGDTFFLIDSGEATITIGGEDRGPLTPGDYFGETALFDGGPSAATVTATGDLACYGLPHSQFHAIVDNNVSIRWKLLQTLAKLIRAAE